MTDTNPVDVSQRLEFARKVSEQKGERFTPLRAHIFELVCQQNGAIKAYDLLDQLKPEHGSPKPTCSSIEERHAHDHTDCRPQGFKITRSVVEHYGQCGKCDA